MKKVLMIITVLTGGLAIAASVLQKLGRLSPVLKANAGAVAFLGKPHAPSAVFAVSKVVPMVFSNLLVRFFGSVSVLSAKSLLPRAKRPGRTKKE